MTKEHEKKIEELQDAHYELIIHIASKARFMTQLQDEIKDLNIKLTEVESEIEFIENGGIIN